eukprot:14234893-Ditylum_brightwellii.AAC.1
METILLRGGVSLRWCLRGVVYATPADVASKAEAKFKLKTALGVSDDYYRHCKMFPIYGTGQG